MEQQSTNHLRISLFLACFIAGGAVAAGPAGVYKWTDDRGHTHYTQYKPLNYESVKVDAPPPPPSNAPDLNAPFAEQIKSDAASGQEKKKQARRETADKNKSAKRQKNCETAKNNLKILEEQRIVSYTDEYGEKIRMGEEQREQNIKDARKQIEFFCE